MVLINGLMATLVFSLMPGVMAKTIDIGAEDDWPPFSSKGRSPSEPQGLSPQLVREVFQAVGVEVRFSTLPFARCMQYAQEGQLVGCFNATRLASNEHTYCWHPTPMFHEELAIYAAAAAGTRELGPGDLAGRRVGLTIGYTYPREITHNPLIKRHQVSSDDHLLKLLATGRVDFALMNATPAASRLAANPQLFGAIQRVGVISLDGFWLAFSKKHPDAAEMCEAFEAGLRTLQRSGRYQTLMQGLPRQPKR